MTTMERNAVAARDKLFRFIEKIEDKRVIHLYEFLKAEVDEEEEFELSDEVKAELDQIEKDYENGVKFYTRDEIKAHTQELLKSLRTEK